VRSEDEQLLERLGSALAPPAAEPSPGEVAALHRMVAGHDDAVATVAAVAPRRVLGWRLGLVAAAALVLLVAVVANRPGTDPRSAELARAQTSLQELRGAIDQGDREAVVAALADVDRRLAVLEPVERAELEPTATTLEEQARALLAVPPTTLAPTTTVPPPSQTVTTVDDKGGQRDRSGSNSGPG
jgi:hypothetical protein